MPLEHPVGRGVVGVGAAEDRVDELPAPGRQLGDGGVLVAAVILFLFVIEKFIPEMIGREIEKATSSIYPLQNVFIRKVKILKAPKFDLGKLMEVHGDYSEDVGLKIGRAHV